MQQASETAVWALLTVNHNKTLRTLSGNGAGDNKPAPLFFTPTRRLVIIAAKKYTEEKVNAVYDGIINLTPVIHKDDRQEQKDEIEKTLYAVFSKYTPKKK